MPKSMTGYARAEKLEENTKIRMEIKSVNHRYSDINIKLPRRFVFMEEKIRQYIGQRVSRGKIDVFLTVEGEGAQSNTVMVNEALAQSYLEGLRLLAEKTGVRDDISVTTLARYPDVFAVDREDVDEDESWKSVYEVLVELMDKFVAMREVEGENLKADVIERADIISGIVDEIEKANPETVSEYQQNLKAKIVELIGDRHIDESRLLTEVAIFADKVAVAEEITRLRSHIEALKTQLDGTVPCGRKLDFIVQEMNREINTIGSKCNDIAISQKVVDVKAEIEKIREQIQNIE